MLQRLFIQNVALIERLDIELSAGFNVFTGETGAGKSIIIDAVNLILGERASKELIKHGAAKAVVEAVFDISGLEAVKAMLLEQGVELQKPEENELLLSRELSVAGKSVCRINGALVTLNVLKNLTDLMVDVHGQHEHQSLISPNTHIRFLDSFAGETLNAVKRRVADIYLEYKALREEQLSGFSSEEERAREMDVLAYQIKEIAAAKLSTGEEEQLLAERTLLANSGRIAEALEGAYYALNGETGTLSSADAARRGLADIAQFSEEYSALQGRLDETYYALEDITITLRDMKNGSEFDPARLNELENRLELISNLKHKYGGSVENVLAFADRAQQRLAALEKSDERRAKLEQLTQDCKARYAKAAGELSGLRHEAAERLTHQLLTQLSELGMDKAQLEVRFDNEPGVISPNGLDRLEFMLTTNLGEPLKPLSKVASGGEMSRIMLAFKTICADRDEISTLIFDEVDTGISGRMAAVVGEKMVSIADNHQVICITHLPQIAALADSHYLVEKHDDGTATHTEAHLLQMDGRCRSIALMMDGNPDSEVAKSHARELIEACEKEKIARRGSGA